MADQSDVHVEFFLETVKNEAKSRAEGRPIHDEQEFVRIRFPGDKHRELVAPASQPSLRDPATNAWLTYAERYPRHYEAFKRNAVFLGDGTPLDEAPFLSNAQKADFKALNIHTIDALAGLSDATIAKLGMGMRPLVEQARAYLAKAKDSAVETRLAAENADLRAQLQALGDQVAALARGQAVAPPAPAPVEPAESSPFAGWDASSLKAYIKDQTGETPKGNPSLETLMRMAEDARPNAA